MATELHNCDTLLGKMAEMKPLLSKQVQAQKVLMEDERKSSSKSSWPFPRLAVMRLKLRIRTKL